MPYVINSKKNNPALHYASMRPSVYRQLKKLNTREKRQVKRIVGYQQEKKNYPIYLVNGSGSSAGTIFNCSAITQGDSGIQREGNQVSLKEILFRYTWISGDATNFCRLILFQWKNDNTNDVPTVAKILQDTTNNSWLSPYIFANQDFRVLYDKVLSVTGTGPAAVNRTVRIRSKKFASRIKYSAGVTTGSNQIYMLYISDSASVTHPTFNMNGKLVFTDS